MKYPEPATAINPSDGHPAVGLSAAALPIAPGTLVGGYRVVRAIGGGGMGEVYEALDDELGRAVALKVMRSDRAADPDARERFVREARALASVADPHVVAIHHVGQHDGQPFLVMELVAGGTLDARLRTGPLPLLQMIQTAREIAAGLAAAHRAGVVHRDVKPDNVVLAAPDGRAKLIDFGLAHTARVGEEGRESVGTPLYMAPEQVLGEAVTARTDLFSFGVLLYRMATGRMPFEGESLKEWREVLLSEQPPRPPEDHNPALPPPLADLILRLLARRPDDRPEGARAVEWELTQILQWVANQSGVITFATPTPTPSDTTRDNQPTAKPPRRLWPIAVVGLFVAGVAFVALTVAVRPPTEAAAVTTPTSALPTASPTTRPSPAVPTSTIPTTPLAVKPPPKPVDLFDGKSLSGWRAVGGKGEHWSVKGGVLVGHPKLGGDQFLLTDAEFTEYTLAFEFRWPDKGDHTSVVIRATEEGGAVSGLDVNLYLGPDEATNRNERLLYENPHHAAGGLFKLRGPSTPVQNAPLGKWNAVKVTNTDSRLTVEWNGKVTFDEALADHADKQVDVPALGRTSGRIALRTHRFMPVEYRNLVVTPLK